MDQSLKILLQSMSIVSLKVLSLHFNCLNVVINPSLIAKANLSLSV